ncbi:uncharacterized protein LOC126906963 [Daktulosphaira vitifoliae]|uniref:uncharacterized protein LOC126906963 n=1 Tax=Daktulosphaira vitifoliae TaxID=58002 RepID=UPI0021AA1B39|nr:uncharacterized protein LOC126906963 [Daktulosphaira vitifoliae]XP_050543900.1 uncharacterized protein LOC126906963 [Daktulosphaira vitifoliae]
MVSRTGLLAAPLSETYKNDNLEHERSIELTGLLCNPAPFVMKPLATLYNPYPYGCSVLCNHPLDNEIKDLVKKAKDALTLDPKSSFNIPDIDEINIIVPEELFRKYTETDSRATSPLPVTIIPKIPIQEQKLDKSKLVLELGRSRSQQSSIKFSGVVSYDFCEAFSLCQGSVLHMPSITKSVYQNDLLKDKKLSSNKKSKCKKQFRQKINITEKQVDYIADNLRHLDLSRKLDVQKDNNEIKEVTWRKGKPVKIGKKAKQKFDKKISKQRNIKDFKGFQEPLETQISSMNPNSPVRSVVEHDEATEDVENHKNEEEKDNFFIDPVVLKELQRELQLVDVDIEFDTKKHIALEEALRMRSKITNQKINEELEVLKQDIGMTTKNINLPGLPRTFSRKNIRFELPIDRKSLKDMKPLDYLKSNVKIASSCMIIFSRVFEKYLSSTTRLINERHFFAALSEVMGRPFTEQEAIDFQNIIQWSHNQDLNFREWCGLCSAAERLYGKYFVFQPLSKEQDPCNEVESADFLLLDKWLQDIPSENPIYKLLTLIKTV